MRVISLLVVLGLAACVTPSIPIPPPDPSEITAQINTTAGTVSFSYPPDTAYIGGTAYVFNRTQGHGSIDDVNPDGSVGPTTAIKAALGDAIVFSIENGKNTVSTCVVLKDGPQDPNVYCP